MKLISLVLCIFLISFAFPAHAQFTPVADANANPAATQLLNARRNESNAAIAQVHEVDPAGFVDGGTIVFPTLDSAPLYLTLQSVSSDTAGLYFKAASADATAQGFFSVQSGYAVNGSVSMGGGTYLSVESADGGGSQHVISKFLRIQSSLTAPDGNPSGEKLRGGLKFNDSQASGTGPAPVDILFVYTSGLAPTNFAVDSAITLLNTSFSDSRDFNSSDTKVRAKKIGLRRIDLATSSSADTQLNILAQDPTVKALRDEYSADIVVLLASNRFTNSTSTPGELAGIAYQTPQPEFGYAVVGVQYLSTPYIFPHEIGHILGATHERAYIHYKSQAQPYCIRTIMAYDVNCLSFGDLLQPNNYAIPINEFSNQRGVTYVAGVGLVATGNASSNNWDYIGANNWRVASFRDPFLKTLTVSPQSLTAFVGDTIAFTANGTDNQGNGISTQGLVWSSGNTAVVSISPTGVATVVGSGQTTVQATVGPVTTSATVLGQARVAASIEVMPIEATISKLSSGVAITATVKDAQGVVIPSAVVTWSSSNPGVASVNASGEVVASSPGSAVITASSGGKSAITNITSKVRSCTSNCK